MAYGATGDLSGARRARALFVVLALTAGALLAMRTSSSTPDLVSIIVRADAGRSADAARAVTEAGGALGLPLDVLNGFSARVPRAALDSLAREDAVVAIWPDDSVVLASDAYPSGSTAPYDAAADPNSMYRVVKDVINADSMWSAGYTGAGIDVALIDSGVVPVDGLTRPGKVINGPDLSFESQFDQTRYLDTFGHGTHMAGIITGRDDAAPSRATPSAEHFQGVAPGSRLVSVKVADEQGHTDVSQVIAAIDWVIKHKKDPAMGLNIRVLNLAFGTDGIQPYATDPFTYAVEQAWKAGIVVVVAAGNSSFGNDELNNPATDPYVIAVGAAETNGTNNTSGHDVPEWSADGTLLRSPDLVAPGKSIQSLRDPGSMIDLTYPTGVIDDRFFRGSGTSQAASMVSGAAALLLDQRPGMNPDQVKALLKKTARKIPNATTREQGAGLIDLAAARSASTPWALFSKQLHVPATGLGSLDAARGTMRVVSEGVELVGEQDIFGTTFNLIDRLLDVNHDDDLSFWWNGTWGARSWSGISWDARSWSATDWAARSWSARSWSGLTWEARSWSARSWSAEEWEARSWSARSWSARSWSSAHWGDDTA